MEAHAPTKLKSYPYFYFLCELVCSFVYTFSSLYTALVSLYTMTAFVHHNMRECNFWFLENLLLFFFRSYFCTFNLSISLKIPLVFQLFLCTIYVPLIHYNTRAKIYNIVTTDRSRTIESVDLHVSPPAEHVRVSVEAAQGTLWTY